MDFSIPTNLIGLVPRFDADPMPTRCRPDARREGRDRPERSGDLLYWTGPESGRSAAVARMRAIATATPGVESVVPPGEIGAGPAAGDLVAFCRPGYRFSDPTPVSNPIPGNHGHRVTQPIPLVISGGRPELPRARTVATPVRTLDVAPGVAGLFGLRPPPGGWDSAGLPA